LVQEAGCELVPRANTAKRLCPKAQGCALWRYPGNGFELMGQPGTGCVLRLRLRSNNNDCPTAQPRGGWNIINSLILWVAESGNPGLWAATASRYEYNYQAHAALNQNRSL